MKMSARGRKVLTQREGVRLNAYRDSVGVWTIGIGHTSAAGAPQVTPTLSLTLAEVDRIFARDLVQYENAVNRAVRVPMAQHEFDALVSFCFNVGVNGLARSTVVRRLNEGDRKGAADAFLMWNKPAEIVGRRRAERLQFLTPYPEAAGNPPAVEKAKDTVIAGGGVVVGGAVAAGVQQGWPPWAWLILLAVVAGAVVGGILLLRHIRRRRAEKTAVEPPLAVPERIVEPVPAVPVATPLLDAAERAAVAATIPARVEPSPAAPPPRISEFTLEEPQP